jgi:hypothetical protein
MLAARWVMSKSAAITTQNHPHPVRPKPGVYRMTYISVANGKKMMPSSPVTGAELRGAAGLRSRQPHRSNGASSSARRPRRSSCRAPVRTGARLNPDGRGCGRSGAPQHRWLEVLSRAGSRPRRPFLPGGYQRQPVVRRRRAGQLDGAVGRWVCSSPSTSTLMPAANRSSCGIPELGRNVRSALSRSFRRLRR